MHGERGAESRRGLRWLALARSVARLPRAGAAHAGENKPKGVLVCRPSGRESASTLAADVATPAKVEVALASVPTPLLARRRWDGGGRQTPPVKEAEAAGELVVPATTARGAQDRLRETLTRDSFRFIYFYFYVFWVL